MITLGAGNVHEVGTRLAKDLATLDRLREVLAEPEGVLKLYWGLHSAIQLKEEDDQRLPCNNNSSPKYQRRVVSNGIEFQVIACFDCRFYENDIIAHTFSEL